MEQLDKQDFQNILACLSMAKVEGINAAGALLQLYNKVARISQGIENGNGNSTESAQPSAGQPAAAADHVDAGN